MESTLWWQRGTIYQIYPRSFLDSNGDGIGDLEGIRQRLGHLVALGVDAAWISPFFPSPMADFGYDVADYCGVDPIFGTLEDFDRLIAEAHRLGLRIILDFVPNHTSDQHPWFVESRQGRDSAKRDWYIWRDPAPGGGPPNNWVSNFGGSAWQFDPASGQYYYHAFLKEQPDLNWRNPAVVDAMMAALRFWLERGVDGFRVDVIWHLIKDGAFRDNPPNPGFSHGQPDINRFLQIHSTDQPEIFRIITRMRETLAAYGGDRVLIGEIYLPVERLVAYYGERLAGVHLPFNFQLILASWNARGIARLIDDYEQALPEGGWPNWVLGNHDQRRVAGRIGSAQARVAAMLLLTLRGTPTIYYGDELGMPDVPVPPALAQDPWERNEPGLGVGRDPERTPMRWDASPKAGFTTGEPWLPIGPEREINVADETADPRSMFSLHRRLLGLRRAHEALSLGQFELIPTTGDLIAYRRRQEKGEGGTEEVLTVVLNLGSRDAELDLGQGALGHGALGHGAVGHSTGAGWRCLVSTHLDREGAEPAGPIRLRPDEGLVLAEG
ncbi:alpha-amylase family glycosyl hydrolase [Ancylobacter sp. 6x-1]|uniref:Alpha-amylase family glycosyl hydrolase n=1 Tax=Ancylobacter crimeensis TaxID=2579147 RepID=A0ABT0DDZ6_9HYPH|nr:alpha-amylase family glycosyl hydrolase [Ancylobacter crimeensis]MCK0198099.1 alpha-amylase family glycosyl hydrolase [Ancylobacter crimeensis]